MLDPQSRYVFVHYRCTSTSIVNQTRIKFCAKLLDFSICLRKCLPMKIKGYCLYFHQIIIKRDRSIVFIARLKRFKTSTTRFLLVLKTTLPRDTCLLKSFYQCIFFSVNITGKLKVLTSHSCTDSSF